MVASLIYIPIEIFYFTGSFEKYLPPRLNSISYFLTDKMKVLLLCSFKQIEEVSKNNKLTGLYLSLSKLSFIFMIRFITTVLTCEQFNYQETTRQSVAFTDINGNDLKDTVLRDSRTKKALPLISGRT